MWKYDITEFHKAALYVSDDADMTTVTLRTDYM